MFKFSGARTRLETLLLALFLPFGRKILVFGRKKILVTVFTDCSKRDKPGERRGEAKRTTRYTLQVGSCCTKCSCASCSVWSRKVKHWHASKHDNSRSAEDNFITVL